MNILEILVGSAKALGLVVFIYFFYYRVVDYMYAAWFYRCQGKDVAVITPRFLPLFGSIFNIL